MNATPIICVWESWCKAKRNSSAIAPVSSAVSWPTYAQNCIGDVAPFVSSEFATTSLSGENETADYKVVGIEVFRTPNRQPDDPDIPTITGDERFVEALRDLAGAASSLDVHFKIINVLIQPDAVAVTRVLVQANSREDGRKIQQNATWFCKWERLEDQDSQPRRRRTQLTPALGAAYAAAGEFEKAAQTAEKAIAVLRACSGDEAAAAAAMKARLARYQEGKAYVEERTGSEPR